MSRKLIYNRKNLNRHMVKMYRKTNLTVGCPITNELNTTQLHLRLRNFQE